MTEPMEPAEPVISVPPKSSRWKGGCLGCTAGGGIALGGLIVWIFFSQQLGLRRGASAAIAIVLVAAAGVASYRSLHRKDPATAVGLLIGLAIAGLLAGMCASY